MFDKKAYMKEYRQTEKYKTHMKEHRKKYQQTEKYKIASKKYKQTKISKAKYNKRHSINENKRYHRLKIEIYNAYGGASCNCCGENESVFLTIDHINGGGNEHRKKVGSGIKFYNWLKKNSFPPGFQILCFNCNLAKHMLGICPHQV